MGKKGLSEEVYRVELSPTEIDTMDKLFCWACQRWADKVFMRHKDLGIWYSWTWREVYDEVKYISLGLISFGLKPGEIVGLIGENEPQLFWGEWATLAARGTAVCLYPDMTPQEMHYMLDHSEAVCLLCEDQEQVDKALELKDRLPKIRKVIYWDSRGMWQYSDPILMTLEELQAEGRSYEQSHPHSFEDSVGQGKGSDIAVMSYTSGTTGLPKGVIDEHRGLIDSAYRIMDSLPEMNPFAQYLSYIAPAWATEQSFGLCLGLLLPFVINFPEEPETVLENIRELAVEFLSFGPRQWEMMVSAVQARMMDASRLRRFWYEQMMKVGLKVHGTQLVGKRVNPIWWILYPLARATILRPLLDQLGLIKCKTAFTGGTAMAPEVFNFFLALGIKLRNLYGTSEFGFISMHQGDRYDVESIGKLVPINPAFGPEIKILVDKETRELLLKGGSGFRGYFKNPKATEEKFKDGWCSTGDAVSINERNNELIFLDRVEDIRRLSTGLLVPPQFIEIRLRFSPFIKDGIILCDEEKPFVSALVNIDPETVGRWAEKNGVSYATFPDLSQKEEVRKLIASEVKKVNDKIEVAMEPGAKIRKFINLPKEFDPDESELTRTRKLRRSFLEDRYKDFIDAIYEGKSEGMAKVPVKYRDGRTGTVAAIYYVENLESTEAGV